MDDPIPQAAASPDEHQTEVVPAPVPPNLVRQNAGRILGAMLGRAMDGAEREGVMVGPYRLCEMLGSGGFGNVWRAEQTQVVKREVAVKVIKLGMDTAQVLGRFNQERQALASLDHPNIATMLDAGVTADGRPYFAMEWVRGGSVTEWCEASESPLHERLRLFTQVCLAVHHAHEKGILHRDLKPSNILVTEIDGQPVAKVIDFGIAKAINATSLSELTMLTQADQVIGTPIYMAPEQLEGGRELDARCDVYALGVLLYELLTGAQPFDSTTLGTHGPDAMKRMILETVPERPSTRVRRHATAQRKRTTGLQSRLASLPADLDWVTMRALEKDRDRRYASAAELAADVQRHLDCVPVNARPASVVYKASRWIRRHRAACVSSSIGLSLGLLVLAVPQILETVPWRKTMAAIRQASFFQPQFKATPSAAAATKDMPFANTLGMKFVAVPIVGGPTNGQRVLFSIWETRVQDYEVFVKETGHDGTVRVPYPRADAVRQGDSWQSPGFSQEPTHAVCAVSWQDAKEFSAWLTSEEHKHGSLPAGMEYRLPTDHEWSCAIGIGGQEDPSQTPAAKSRKLKGYPWGDVWPPPVDAGNYSSGEAITLEVPLKIRLQDRRDGYAATAPVGSFRVNAHGLFDLGGNVWEWCEDWLDQSQSARVMRGGSWMDASPGWPLRSTRTSCPPTARVLNGGFRLVLAPASPAAPSAEPGSKEGPQKSTPATSR